MLHLSFSKTWTAYARGEIKLSSDDSFRFNCTKSHLCFDKWDMVPCEVSWIKGSSLIGGPLDAEQIPANSVSEEIFKLYRNFQTIVALAEKAGRAHYRFHGIGALESFAVQGCLTEEEKLDYPHLIVKR